MQPLEAAVARMVAVQTHRGPDEQRVVHVPTGAGALVLGFDRLAILDPSTQASQPMRHAPTGSWLVFNGEIYNFRALREELEGLGHRVRSSGDTETLLAAMIEWGLAAIPRLRGMFAFAFFDGRTRRLVLARDPFGVKPLLYGWQCGRFVFASELRAIRAAGVAPLAIDPEGLTAYRCYGAVPEPLTIARGVSMLPAGHVLEVVAPAATATPRPLVTLADLVAHRPDDGPRDFEAAVRQVGQTLEASVSGHLVSDVPLGVLLSGGVDSTVVASLAARAGGRPQFLTIGFDDPRFNEALTAHTTALRLHGTHHVVRLGSQDVLDLLPDVLAAMDQPTADGVNTFVITRAAAEHGIKVLVSGLGGDEVFGGYSTFRKAPVLARHAGGLALAGRLLTGLRIGNVPQWAKLAASARVRELREAYLVQRSLDGDVAGRVRYGLPEAAWRPLAPAASWNDFQRLAWLELGFYLRNQLLRDADVFSSANSVELRVPFLDADVVRTAWSLPPRWHLGHGGKHVLKAVLRMLEPTHPVGRQKMGFVFPWEAWLRGPLGDRVAATLLDRDAHERLGLEPAHGRDLLAAWRRRDRRVGWAALWSHFVLVEWLWRSELDAPTAAEGLRARA